jgi:ABC-type nitrate/sulfonate/bicarbonate transport system permease component
MTSWPTIAPDVAAPTTAPVSGPAVLDPDERFDLAQHRAGIRRARLRRIGLGVAGLAVVLALWELIAVLLNDPVALPTVSATASAFGHYLTHPYPSQSKTLPGDLAISLQRILIGFAIGTVIGVAVGAAMSASQVIRQLIPLFIVWFGIGELPKEVLLVFGTVPIMTVATVAALKEVPDDLRLCARTLGASRGYSLVHVQIPAALPGIVTGMRFAMAGAWTSIVAAEMLAATSGVGYLISQAGNYLNTGLVFAGIITIAITGLILDACLRGLLLLVDPSRRS